MKKDMKSSLACMLFRMKTFISNSAFSFDYIFGAGIFRDIEFLTLLADSNIFNIEDLVANRERRKHASYLSSQSKSSEN